MHCLEGSNEVRICDLYTFNGCMVLQMDARCAENFQSVVINVLDQGEKFVSIAVNGDNFALKFLECQVFLVASLRCRITLEYLQLLEPIDFDNKCAIVELNNFLHIVSLLHLGLAVLENCDNLRIRIIIQGQNVGMGSKVDYCVIDKEPVSGFTLPTISVNFLGLLLQCAGLWSSYA